jgi:MFS-type transporter involved in bile tolerance (Atg22 family)
MTVCSSLFRWVAGTGDVLLLILLFGAPVTILLSWVQFAEGVFEWGSVRGWLTLSGLLANSAAFFGPFLGAILDWRISSNYLRAGCVGLSAFSMLAGILGSPKLRFELLFGGLATAILWMLIPGMV